MLVFAERGHGEGPADGPDPRSNQENRIKTRSPMKNVLGENRQKHNQGERQQRHHESQNDQRHHGALVSDEVKPFLHAGQNRFAALAGHEVRMDDQKRNNHGNKGNAVESEAPRRAQQRQRDAAHRGAQYSRHVKLN